VTEPIALESIMSCFRGVIPSPFATCLPDGTPNITYMSIVHYVDADRVALSRQFFNKTRENLDRNPASEVRVVDPETMQQYNLDLVYLHT
jgi:adenylate cyclase